MNRYEIALGKKPPPKPTPVSEPEPERIYYLGIDMSHSRSSPTAVAICHVKNDSSIALDYLEESHSIGPYDIRNWIMNLNMKYPLKKGLSDFRDFQPMWDSSPLSKIMASIRPTQEMVDLFNTIAPPILHLAGVSLTDLSEHKRDASKLCLWALHEDFQQKAYRFYGRPFLETALETLQSTAIATARDQFYRDINRRTDAYESGNYTRAYNDRMYMEQEQRHYFLSSMLALRNSSMGNLRHDSPYAGQS